MSAPAPEDVFLAEETDKALAAISADVDWDFIFRAMKCCMSAIFLQNPRQPQVKGQTD